MHNIAPFPIQKQPTPLPSFKDKKEVSIPFNTLSLQQGAAKQTAVPCVAYFTTALS